MKHIYTLLLFIAALSGITACDDGNDFGNGYSVALQIESVINGHKCVDLGLSVKWATTNVGADSPEEYGDYFAWGETEPKDNYYWDTYTLCQRSSIKINKYCTSWDNGTVDDKTTLELDDDAAHANWGGTWRMPTYSELNELNRECTWKRTTLNGKSGYKVTSNINGNSIFLPSAGYIDRGLVSARDYGEYWSSSLALRSSYAHSLRIAGDGYSDHFMDNYHERCYGLSVRPVCP